MKKYKLHNVSLNHTWGRVSMAFNMSIGRPNNVISAHTRFPKEFVSHYHEGSTLPQERPDDGFDTTILANISGLYKTKTCCDDVDKTSFTASHEYQFNSGEGNSRDSSHKLACIITNFLKSLTNLAGCDEEEDGILTVHLNTSVSQTEDGENCLKVQKCILPTITIEATDCQVPSHLFCGKCDQSENLKESQKDLTKDQNFAKRTQNSGQNLETSFESSFSTSQESSAFSSASEEETFLPITRIGYLGNFETTQITPEQTITNFKSGQKRGKPTGSFIKHTGQGFSSSTDESTLPHDEVIFPPVSATPQRTRNPNLPRNDNSFSDSHFNTAEKTKTNEEIDEYERQGTLTSGEVPQRIPFYTGVNPVTQANGSAIPSDYLEGQKELNQFEQERATTPLSKGERPQIIQPQIQTQLKNSFANRQEYIGSSSQQTETPPSQISSKESSASYSQAETNSKSEIQIESAYPGVSQGNQFPLTGQLQRQTIDPVDKVRFDSVDVYSQEQTSTATFSESAYQTTKDVAYDVPVFNNSPNQKSDEDISEQLQKTKTQVPQPQPSLDNSYYSDQLSTNERELNTYPKGLQTSKTLEESDRNFQPPVNHPPLHPPSLKTSTPKSFIESVNDYSPPYQIYSGPTIPSNTYFGLASTSLPLVRAYPEGFDARNSALRGQSKDQLIGHLIPPNNQKQIFSPEFGLPSLRISSQNQTFVEEKEISADRIKPASLPPFQRPPMDYFQRHSDEKFQNSTIPHFLKPYDSYPGHKPINYPPQRYSSQRHFENDSYNNYPRFNTQGPRPGFSQTHYFPGEDFNHFFPLSQYNRFNFRHPFPNQFYSEYNPALENIQTYPYRNQFFNNGNGYLFNERPNFHYNPMKTPEYLLPSQPYPNNFRFFRNEPEYVLKQRGVQFWPYELQKEGQLENEHLNIQMLPHPHGQNFESVPHYQKNHYNDRFGNKQPFKNESLDIHPKQVPDNQEMSPFRYPQGHYPHSFSGHFLNNTDHRVEDQYRRPLPFYPLAQPSKELNKAQIQNTVRNQKDFEALNDYKKTHSDLGSSERLVEFDEKVITQSSNQKETREQLQNAAFSSRNQNLPETFVLELNRPVPGQMPDKEFRRLGVQQTQAQPQGNPVFGSPEHQLNIPPPDSSREHF